MRRDTEQKRRGSSSLVMGGKRLSLRALQTYKHKENAFRSGDSENSYHSRVYIKKKGPIVWLLCVGFKNVWLWQQRLWRGVAAWWWLLFLTCICTQYQHSFMRSCVFTCIRHVSCVCPQVNNCCAKKKFHTRCLQRALFTWRDQLRLESANKLCKCNYQ